MQHRSKMHSVEPQWKRHALLSGLRKWRSSESEKVTGFTYDFGLKKEDELISVDDFRSYQSGYYNEEWETIR